MFGKSILVLIFVCALSLGYGREVRIVSFDGGGVRGVATLEIMKNLQDDTGIKIHEDFDVFAGTSTGSIIAVAMAMGMSVDDMISDYIALSEDVFSGGSYIHLFHPKYDRKALRTALLQIFTSLGYDENICLKDLPKKVVIPTVRLNDPQSGRWKMEVRENFTEEGGETKVIDAILESTAAPTYFSSYENSIDGGMAMNDPSLAAYTYAYRPYRIQRNGAVLFAIGTGYIKEYIEGEANWGDVEWLSPVASKPQGSTPLISLLLDVEQQVPGQLLSILLPDSYRKFNFPLSKDVSLDDYNDMKQLIKETNQYITANVSLWEETCSWLTKKIIPKQRRD